MTARYIHSVLAFCICILCIFGTCGSPVNQGDSDQSKKADSLIGGFVMDFSSDYLTNEQLQLFGERGKQKVLDFADLSSQYTRNDLAPLFKEHIHEMIIRNFTENNSPVQLWPLENRTVMGISDWLSEVADTPVEVSYSITGLKITEPLHLESDGIYKGMAKGIFHIVASGNNDTTYQSDSGKDIELEVRKMRKSFGNDSFNDVWQVFLNRIE